jgi:hypothetical protein
MMYAGIRTAFGISGDLLTLLGGLVLLIKEFSSVHEFREVEAARRHLREFPEDFFITKRGETINNAEDLQTSILTHNARRARIGAILITLGFAFLLITRVAENSAEGKLEKQLHLEKQKETQGSQPH